MTEGPRDVQFVFVLGTGRCGSTLVQEVLSRHPDVGFLSNLEDRLPAMRLGRRAADLYRSMPATWTTKGSLRFAPSEGYRALGSEVSPALVAPSRDLLASDATPWVAARTRNFFQSRADRHGRATFIHKFTGWPRIGFLREIWPTCRFIHIVRDGRAVANSLVQMPWWHGWAGPQGWSFGPLSPSYAAEWDASGQSYAVLAGLEWKLLMDAFLEASGTLPAQQWLEMRYEDIVSKPRDSFAQLLDHCDLTWSAAFERTFLRQHFSAGRTLAYRDDLGAAAVADLERTLRRHLDRFGYLNG